MYQNKWELHSSSRINQIIIPHSPSSSSRCIIHLHRLIRSGSSRVCYHRKLAKNHSHNHGSFRPKRRNLLAIWFRTALSSGYVLYYYNQYKLRLLSHCHHPSTLELKTVKHQTDENISFLVDTFCHDTLFDGFLNQKSILNHLKRNLSFNDPTAAEQTQHFTS